MLIEFASLSVRGSLKNRCHLQMENLRRVEKILQRCREVTRDRAVFSGPLTAELSHSLDPNGQDGGHEDLNTRKT